MGDRVWSRAKNADGTGMMKLPTFQAQDCDRILVAIERRRFRGREPRRCGTPNRRAASPGRLIIAAKDRVSVVLTKPKFRMAAESEPLRTAAAQPTTPANSRQKLKDRASTWSLWMT